MDIRIKTNRQFNRKESKTILYDIGFKQTTAKRPIAIFAHGFKGSKDWGHIPLIMNYFVEHNFAFLKFNFSHNGGTLDNPIDFPDLEAFGNNNLSKEITDLNDVINYVFENNVFPNEEVDLNEIYVIGHSRGGGISLLTTQLNKKIKKIVTWASVSDYYKRLPQNLSAWQKTGTIFIENTRTKQQMPMYYQFVEDLMANKKTLTIEKAVKNIQIPQLIIHGTNDATVLVDEAQQIKKWNPNAVLHLIENADHTFGGKHPFLDEELPNFSIELVTQTTAFLKK